MSNPQEPYEIRDPVHGFIQLNGMEWEIINHPDFQRLRRIRQLGWTDMVYPGATHSRFEHSIGVMHVASRIFDALVRRNTDILKSDYGFDVGSLMRQRRLIRLAALLHDVGHGPFSHAAEELLPDNPQRSGKFTHEDYSVAVIEHRLRDCIENHPEAKINGIGVEGIVEILRAPTNSSGVLVWQDLVSGQMDADRMDYLLRDAHHAGVQYGRYDLDRLIYSLRLCPDTGDTGAEVHQIGVEEGGVHALEGLLIARFMMFTQIYFHKTRVIYDHHLVECLKELLDSGVFPPPDKIGNFLEWDDWKVFGRISDHHGGEHGRFLRERRHYRMVYSTSEKATVDEISEIDEIQDRLTKSNCVVCDAEKSWYKSGSEEIRVWRISGGSGYSTPLQDLSPVVNGLIQVNQRRLFVPEDCRLLAEQLISTMNRNEGNIHDEKAQ